MKTEVKFKPTENKKFSEPSSKIKKTEIGLIPEDWEVINFEKVTNNFDNQRIPLSTMQRKNKKGNIRYYGASGIIDYIDEYIFDGTYLLVSEDGENLKSRKSPISFLVHGRFWVNNHAHIINCKDNYDIHFLNFWLSSNSIAPYLSGSVQPKLSKSNLNRIQLPLPSIKEQSAIAKILSDLDSKIELLQKQNETLEKIGQAIFKQWFVDFEFPNEDGLPYKSSGGEMVESELGEIPEGWSVGFLDDGISTKLIKTGINTFEGEKIYLDTASVQNSDIVDLSTKIAIDEKPSRANMQPIPKSIWFAKMKDSKKVLLIDSRDDWLIKNIILSTGFSGLTTFNDLLYYIWTIVNSDKFEIEKNSLCLGTTMQAINNENIRKIKYIIPSNEFIQLFNIATSKSYEKISSNKLEIVNLQKTRDLLLPKLMTGKIRVPLEVEK